MKVSEYLYSADLTAERLAELLGYKTVGTITRKLDDEMPVKWARKLEELADLGIQSPAATDSPKAVDSDETSEREPKLTDDDINNWINSEGRDGDKDPNINNMNSGVEVIGPQQIKLSTIKGYVEMIYGGAESLARQRGDDIAAETIHRYTPEYVEAWMDYIKFDPRILKYLEMLNIGTPLGNLVGIHAVSIGAYVLARVTARELARNTIESNNGEVEI